MMGAMSLGFNNPAVNTQQQPTQQVALTPSTRFSALPPALAEQVSGIEKMIAGIRQQSGPFAMMSSSVDVTLPSPPDEPDAVQHIHSRATALATTLASLNALQSQDMAIASRLRSQVSHALLQADFAIQSGAWSTNQSSSQKQGSLLPSAATSLQYIPDGSGAGGAVQQAFSSYFTQVSESLERKAYHIASTLHSLDTIASSAQITSVPSIDPSQQLKETLKLHQDAISRLNAQLERMEEALDRHKDTYARRLGRRLVITSDESSAKGLTGTKELGRSTYGQIAVRDVPMRASTIDFAKIAAATLTPSHKAPVATAPTPSTFQAGTSLFGKSAAPAGSLFGGSLTTSAPAGGGLFGSSTTAPVITAPTGSLFGTAAPGSLFGSSAAAKPASSLFGGPPAAGTSLFGSSTPAASSLFGASAAGGSSLFGGPGKS